MDELPFDGFHSTKLQIMKIAVLDPASGIAGDMFIGALVDNGLDKAWLERLPATLGLAGVGVRIADVQRSGVRCVKVDFDIPEQPHGRVVGSVWGVELLGIERIYNTKVALGDGTVKTAHGLLPVPAPATIRLLEGFNVRHGPPGSGELTTPTGAALLRVLSKGAPPHEYTPRRSGYGAGTRDIPGQLNALRIILGDAVAEHYDHHHHRHEHVHTEHLHVLSDRQRASGFH